MRLGQIPSFQQHCQLINGPMDGKEVIFPSEFDTPSCFIWRGEADNIGYYVLCWDEEIDIPAYIWCTQGKMYNGAQGKYKTG
jgi:hypothetical protein